MKAGATGKMWMSLKKRWNSLSRRVGALGITNPDLFLLLAITKTVYPEQWKLMLDWMERLDLETSPTKKRAGKSTPSSSRSRSMASTTRTTSRRG